MTSNVEEMMKRAESIYGRPDNQPPHGGLYFVTPPPAAKPSEIDEARALVLAFLREIPEIALTLAAFAVILVAMRGDGAGSGNE